MEESRLRERDVELFRLVNTLKSSKAVYRRTQPRLYNDLVARRKEIDHELESDDCYMKVVADKGFLILSFYPDDMDYQNRLRKKFSVNEMRFYIVLLHIYNERYLNEGDYVSVGTMDLLDAWEKLGFVSKTSVATKKFLEPLIRTMKTFGIMTESGNEQFVILPGILFGLDLSSFLSYYDAVLTPWFATTAETNDEQEETK